MSARNYTYSKTSRIENIDEIQALIDNRLSRRAQLEFPTFFALYQRYQPQNTKKRILQRFCQAISPLAPILPK